MRKQKIEDYFDFKERLDEGAYSNVYKAIDKQTNEKVAIKKMKNKFTDWKSCSIEKEIQILKNIKHENIITLKEVIKQKQNLFIVYEYMDMNLLDFYQQRQDNVYQQEQKSS